MARYAMEVPILVHLCLSPKANRKIEKVLYKPASLPTFLWMLFNLHNEILISVCLTLGPEPLGSTQGGNSL